MSEKKEDKDIFLQSIGETTPLKKSNKYYKKIKLDEIKQLKKIESKKEKENVKKKDSTISKLKITTDFSQKVSSSLVRRKLKKGKLHIDKKIDFHGYSLVAAKAKFIETINFCYKSKLRCILFITGKGINKKNENNTEIKLYYGKIRADFQKWILEKNMTSKILYTVPADFSHGGDGSFFVYLRKND